MATVIEIEAQLLELNKVRPIRPTASQLHQRRHALVNRVQRKENKRYWKGVEDRKVLLNKQLLDLQSVKVKKDKSTIIPVIYEHSLASLPQRKQTRIESKKRLKPTR